MSNSTGNARAPMSAGGNMANERSVGSDLGLYATQAPQSFTPQSVAPSWGGGPQQSNPFQMANQGYSQLFDARQNYAPQVDKRIGDNVFDPNATGGAAGFQPFVGQYGGGAAGLLPYNTAMFLGGPYAPTGRPNDTSLGYNQITRAWEPFK